METEFFIQFTFLCSAIEKELFITVILIVGVVMANFYNQYTTQQDHTIYFRRATVVK